MFNLCAPAIIYLIFSITQILIDTYKGLYNTVIVKIIVTIMVTLLLNILCEKDLGFVSWIIVFIPFILMTVIVSVVLYIFGLDAATGNINKYNNSNKNCGNGIKIDSLGNVIVYDPAYNPYKNSVYYQYTNVIVSNPNANYNTVTSQQPITTYQPPIPTGSSSPAYQS